MHFLTFIGVLVTVHISVAQHQKNVILLDHWNDTNIAEITESARYSDLWGFEFAGQKYCAVGSSEGLEVLMLSENKLRRVDRKPAAYQGYTAIHRDYKTYRNYLYAVGDEGTATLQIFDLSYLPDSVSKVYDSSAIIGTCHNIFIDTSTARLYACGPALAAMKILDISVPYAPVLLSDFNGVSYVHDCFVVNDTAFLNCGFDGLHIYDFSGGTPMVLGVLDFYPDQGYNHSGWLSKDRKKYVFSDETQGTKLKLCKVDNLADIQINETFAVSDYQDYVPHNSVILNDLIFVAYYNKGLRIYNSASLPVSEVGGFDTFLEETPYKLNGAWGVFVFEESNQILISDRQTGIYLFEFPIQLFENTGPGTATSNIPFIDADSYLIPKDYLNMAELKFSIADLRGAIVYKQENYLNWLHIPLELSAGVYYYGIYNSEGLLIESGKFAKSN